MHLFGNVWWSSADFFASVVEQLVQALGKTEVVQTRQAVLKKLVDTLPQYGSALAAGRPMATGMLAHARVLRRAALVRTTVRQNGRRVVRHGLCVDGPYLVRPATNRQVARDLERTDLALPAGVQPRWRKILGGAGRREGTSPLPIAVVRPVSISRLFLLRSGC